MTIKIPASKSIMQRAIAAALLAQGKSVLHNLSDCEDCEAAIEIARDLGATITLENGSLVIDSQGVNPISQELNCGEAGLAMRMFTPIAALSNQPMIINGKGSLLKRSMHFFEVVLPKLGVICHTNEGFAPIHVQGKLQPQNLEINGALSSQFLTGLLMSMATVSAGNIITVNHLNSKPYIDLTIDVMNDFGVKVLNFRHEKFVFPYAQKFQPQDYYIEGDWSSAAFWVVLGAIQGGVKFTGLKPNSLQADKVILELVKKLGAEIEITENQPFPLFHIKKSPQLTSFQFDATHCPDLFPILSVLAVHCEGVSQIKGVERLFQKESNRALAIQSELEKVGAKVEIENNKMMIYPEKVKKTCKNLKTIAFHSRNDHRIAMSMMILAHTLAIPYTINEITCINKSYPSFFADFEQYKLSANQ